MAPGVSRHTVAEAADMLGISTGAVRNRLSRGSLRSVKEEGTVYVLLPADMSRDTGRDTRDTPHDMPPSDSGALISAKDETISTLRDQLEAERQAHAEARRIIAGLVERIPPAIEAPQEPPGAAETAEEEAERAEPRPGAPGAQEGAQRPWWRRMFGRA